MSQQLICETNISLILIRVECLQELSSQEDKEVLYNLKIYYDNTFIKNITSVKPIFNLHFNEFHFENNSNPYQILIYAQINGKVVSDVNIMFKIPNNSSDNSVNKSNQSIAISHYNNVMDSDLNKQEYVPRIWISITIAITGSVALIITIVITFKVCIIWKSVKRKRRSKLPNKR